MPQFIVQMFKTHPEYPRPFSNTYRCTADALTGAAVIADAIEAREKEIFDAATTLSNARISTATVGDTVFSNLTYFVAGACVKTTASVPLFKSCRIYVNVSGSGR